ncbi:MAG: acyltransferase [Cytophagales bacterium]|nr:acyltransferase [Armatimonadota bacterium]
MPPSDLSATADSSPKAAQKPPKIHLDFLDGLRGLAAFYVVIHHLLGNGATNGAPVWVGRFVALTAFGHTMVAIFIVLSGFSLMLPIALSSDRRLQGGFGEYVRRRSFRILPPYYAAVLLSLAGLLLTPAGLDFLHGSSSRPASRDAFLANFSPSGFVATSC